MYKTYKDFKDFYEHPFIKSIENDKKWTVSDNTKKPIDIDWYRCCHQITGAVFQDERSLVTLKELCETLPHATNNAYYMDALTDNFVVLDIEKTCPETIKQEFLKTPYIYGETSLSGKGIHLIYPLPKSFAKYPIAQKKVVMREKHGYYEILLQHYVTFTRNMIPKATGQSDAFERVFEKLASNQVETNKNDVDVNDLKPDAIYQEEHILQMLDTVTYRKTPSDFFDDMSKYEYGFVGYFYNKLKNLLDLKKYKDNHAYTENELAWLVYMAVEKKIPHRPKHEEIRDELPWLLYLAREIIAKDESRFCEKKGDNQ